MQEIVNSVIEFSKKTNYPKGFYAGDGDFWLKCDDFQTADKTCLKFIFFIDATGNATCYKA